MKVFESKNIHLFFFLAGKLGEFQNQLPETLNELPDEEYEIDHINMEIEERDDFEDEDSIIKQPELNSQQMKMKDRMRLLRHRCEAGLGNKIFEKGYELIREKCKKYQLSQLGY